MKDREFLEIDPSELHLPGGRRDGADPIKLHRQVVKHGSSVENMPPIEVSRGTDGEYVINNGVTRATRAARYSPGTLVPIEVIDILPVPLGQLPRIGDTI